MRFVDEAKITVARGRRQGVREFQEGEVYPQGRP